MKLIEKYFLNSLRYASCHAALSSFQSSGRITKEIRDEINLLTEELKELNSIGIHEFMEINVDLFEKTPGYIYKFRETNIKEVEEKIKHLKDRELEIKQKSEK